MKALHANQKGMAVITFMVVFVLVAAYSISLLTRSVAENRSATLYKHKTRASYLAEGCAEIVRKIVIDAWANHAETTLPASGTQVVDGQPVNFDLAQVGFGVDEIEADGVRSVVVQYQVVTHAVVQKIHSQVREIFNVRVIPIFQFLIFYNKDLEILPGPSADFLGRIHSNGDIYIGCGNTLTCDTRYIRAVGNIYRRRKNDGSHSTGNVLVRSVLDDVYRNMENYWDFAYPSLDGFDSNFDGYDADGDGDLTGPGDVPPWAVRAWDLWGGTVRTADHGVSELAVPTVQAIDPYVPQAGGDYQYNPGTDTYTYVGEGNGDSSRGFFHRQADLVIIDNVAYDGDGNVINWPDVDGDEVPDNPICDVTFFEGREEVDVTCTQIDVDILNQSGYFPENGLLYATRTDATAAQPNGIRLANGSVLSGPLTVVSDTPVYVWGNFNIGDGGANPKQPAAVITDAINLLSNAWDDTKVDNGPLPHASETWYNLSYITGNYVTEPGVYNGGVENLPRFHERWSNVNCHIYGSFVNLWDSRLGDGLWVYGSDNYTAPRRLWNFDSDLLAAGGLPPFTPRAVGAERVYFQKPRLAAGAP